MLDYTRFTIEAIFKKADIDDYDTPLNYSRTDKELGMLCPYSKVYKLVHVLYWSLYENMLGKDPKINFEFLLSDLPFLNLQLRKMDALVICYKLSKYIFMHKMPFENEL